MNRELISEIVTMLESWKLILYPTDTVWWIWGDATNESVIQSIMTLKGNRENKLWFVMLIHPQHIWNYVDCDIEEITKKIDEIWWPVTFRFTDPKGIPQSMLLQSENTVAMRIPFTCKYLMDMLEVFWKPIISTSANITNHPYPLVFEDIVEEIKNGVQYIVPPELDQGTKKPSTIVWYGDNILFRS